MSRQLPDGGIVLGRRNHTPKEGRWLARLSQLPADALAISSSALVVT
jgi:hypothetical protein